MDPLSPTAMPQTAPSSLLVEAARLAQVIRARLGLLFLCIVLGGGVGLAIYLFATRIYESSAEILVLQTSGAILESNQSGRSSITDFLPTYQRVLTSDSVLEKAIRALPIRHRIDFRGVPKNKWAISLRSRLSVSSARQTHVINLKYTSKHPETAAVVVGAVIDAYLEFMKQTHQSNSSEMLDVLIRQKGTLESQLREKETDLLELKRRSGVLLTGGEKNTHVLIERTVKLNEAFIEAQKRTLEARTLLMAIEHALKTNGDIQQFVMQTADGVGREFLLKEFGMGTGDSYIISRIEQQVSDDKAELDRRLQVYGRAHPDVIELQERIDARQNWLLDRQKSVQAAMQQMNSRELGPKLYRMAEQRLLQAEAHEKSLSEQFERDRAAAMNFNHQLAELEFVEQDHKRMRTFYDLVLEKMSNIDLESDNGLRTRVTTAPRIMHQPIFPRLSSTMLLALLGGLVFGVGLIYVLDALDDRFRSPDEIQRQLNLPVLAMIRQLPQLPGAGLDAVMTFAKPDSVESEAFRTLRSTISFAASATQRLVVTSTEPGDGKTTTLANLAVAFALAKRKTLLIDADMRRPGLTQLLELKGTRGLSQVLRDHRPIAESAVENLFHLGIDNLDVIPSGPRPMNPSELLSTERLSELLSWAETMYDQILVDAPPVLAVADPAIAGRMVDGAVIVIRPDKNRRKMVVRAVQSFVNHGVNVVGLIINHLTPDSAGEYGYGYGYSYGYGHGGDESPDNRDDDEIPGAHRRAA